MAVVDDCNRLVCSCTGKITNCNIDVGYNHLVVLCMSLAAS